mmetsp:Transcript_126665/g.246865  ORF Transcript_126665/g.246865 Transcript_126665/m.246865 type:complete len:263 (+) Transcript_126665:736-1524(+)
MQALVYLVVLLKQNPVSLLLLPLLLPLLHPDVLRKRNSTWQPQYLAVHCPPYPASLLVPPFPRLAPPVPPFSHSPPPSAPHVRFHRFEAFHGVRPGHFCTLWRTLQVCAVNLIPFCIEPLEVLPPAARGATCQAVPLKLWHHSMQWQPYSAATPSVCPVLLWLHAPSPNHCAKCYAQRQVRIGQPWHSPPLLWRSQPWHVSYSTPTGAAPESHQGLAEGGTLPVGVLRFFFVRKRCILEVVPIERLFGPKPQRQHCCAALPA